MVKNYYYLIVGVLLVLFSFSHGDCDLGEIYPQPLTIECCRHHIVVFRSDIHNARNEGDVAIITGTINKRNKFIVRVLYILVVLANFIALIFLVVHKSDDNCVFELYVECVGVLIPSGGTGHQVITQQ